MKSKCLLVLYLNIHLLKLCDFDILILIYFTHLISCTVYKCVVKIYQLKSKRKRSDWLTVKNDSDEW